jgi:lipopolysaccharide/colanic/teichoic acid biosynthesis glycosyltransferase
MPREGFDRVAAGVKRAFDIALASAGLVATAPLSVLVAVAITLEDGGPVLYRQERSGIAGRQFVALKFRSMVRHAEAGVGAVQARRSDPRITAVGRLLRATAMDELPQLWNVLRGDMSVVGPRALRPAEIEISAGGRLERLEDVAGFRERSCVRPGLTGLAQVYAPRDIPRRRKFRYDLLYVRRRSFWLDVRLVMWSLWITLHGSWDVDDCPRRSHGLRLRPIRRSFPRVMQLTWLVHGDRRGNSEQKAIRGDAQSRFPKALQRHGEDCGAAADPQPHE